MQTLKRYVPLLLPKLCCLALLAPAVRAEPELQACVADVMMAPFAYWKLDPRKPAEPVGLAIDVLNAVSNRLKLPAAKVSVLPWRRCLQMMESAQIDLALNVPTGQLSKLDFQLSEPYYTVHSWYFYSNRVHRNGLKINSAADWRRWRVCGLQGYSLQAYGIDAAMVDSGSHDFRSLLGKLKTNRCDLFIEKREVIAGLYLIDPALGTLLFDPEIDHAPVPDDPDSDLRFAFSRKSMRMNGLRGQFDQQIQAMKQSGEIERLMARYIQQ
ncbi:substrate-binding periplasmic protein [Chitinimonas sp.]|uniref:substrate-binding periplasmic protein n=1 Tax=Chitinimonas sp. TaxID=1934313 RepID=UPI0035B190A0